MLSAGGQPLSAGGQLLSDGGRLLSAGGRLLSAGGGQLVGGATGAGKVGQLTSPVSLTEQTKVTCAQASKNGRAWVRKVKFQNKIRSS